MVVKRVFVEKKKGFDVEAKGLLNDLKKNLGITNIEALRIVNRYDISGITEDVYEKAKLTIFSEPPVDEVFDEEIAVAKDEKVFAVEYLPGQYDQRADSTAQCIQMVTAGDRPVIRVAKLIIAKGNIDEKTFKTIKEYYINPVDSREATLEKYNSLEEKLNIPSEVATMEGFIDMEDSKIEKLVDDMGLAMSFEDLKFCRDYFKSENRNPSVTEIKVIDTYWSDHCRHTTFLTKINNVEIEEGKFKAVIEEAFAEYMNARKYVYADKDKDVCLMDMAVIGAKELKKMGKVNDLEESEEINACSIVVDVDVDGENQEWLVMFKNETHNHPTEIEPFGGAATCLGGAIRDPLSGRAYVYQAMRVTGSGDPTTKIEDTIQGKLPQRKITLGAAHGYSSYGNQIGLATGAVNEVYDEGFVAKRMEIGAVIAAAPRENVVRESSLPGDAIVLLGGRTGRDGCGGATGSSKEHDEKSIETCGAEVQKGNPPTERKIQRLFRNPEVSKLIKKCNDFGAGGVSVAIGELADGLLINLDLVPKKYEGLDGTELAISESQERMAVVVREEDVEKFIAMTHEENLEAVRVAEVNDSGRLKMTWNGKTIVDISRKFLDTNGVTQVTDVLVNMPQTDENYFADKVNTVADVKKAWLENLQDLNVCSQKGLVERFDATIGAGTVLMPFGGKYQLTPTQAMAAKIPVLKGETKTATLMSYGYDPKLSKWGQFHGGLYSVIEAVSKIVVTGGDYKKARLTCQEYFEKLGKDKEKWGKPFSALLGAYYAQKKLFIPSIGGKDSMSGTFKDMTVPPTLVTFAVCTANTDDIISPEFKKADSKVVLLPIEKDEFGMPNFERLHVNYTKIHELVAENKILAAHAIGYGGIAAAVSKMSFGNKIGMKFTKEVDLFKADYGSILIEVVSEDLDKLIEQKLLDGINYIVIGDTQADAKIDYLGNVVSIDEALGAWTGKLENVFKTRTESNGEVKDLSVHSKNIVNKKSVNAGISKPKVFIPVFPGTNCEYDTAKAFMNAGATVDSFVIKNLSHNDIEESVEEMVKKINNSQIIMIPGGFSAGDEPEGSGKFIAAVFRNPKITEAVMNLIKNRDGLMLGICNGFQALIKLGLLPYGEIREIKNDDPTLTFNEIGRHVSCIVNTKIVSKLSPWFNNIELGSTHSIAVSHGEGRFFANEEVVKGLIANGQVATQYVDFNGTASMNVDFNPNGSVYAIEGITSPDGRILGKMGHSERIGDNVYKNIIGEKDQMLFKSGVEYFK